MSDKLNEIEVKAAEVVDYLRVRGGFAPAIREVVERKISAEEARIRGFTVSDEELQKGADTYRSLHDLGKASDFEHWLKSIGISLETFEDYLETNLLVAKLKDDLEGKADKTECLSFPEIRDTLRELIYRNWITNELK